MIIKLKKQLFIGSKDAISDFFIRAQEEGFIEFITDGQRKKVFPEPVRNLLSAIKILRKQPLKSPYLGGGDLHFASEVARQILDLTHEVEKLSEEKRLLEAEIARVRPFGRFSFDDIAFIREKTGKLFQFYCVKTSKAHEIADAESLIYIGTEYDLDYFIGIHDEPKHFPGVIEMHMEKAVHELQGHLAFVEETLHQVEAELKGYAGHLDFLRDSLLGQLDIYALENVQKEVDRPISEKLFSIEGWVPENRLDKLPSLIGELPVTYEPIAPEKGEKMPTYMENAQLGAVGEDLVKIYDIPASSDKDPSSWVLWAFTLFFSVILADGGYGLLYLALALFLRHKFPSLKGGARRFLKLLFTLSIASFIWGVVTASFFGIELSPKSALARFSPVSHMAVKKAEYHAEKNDALHREWVEKFPNLVGERDGKEMLAKAVKRRGKVLDYQMFNQYMDNILLECSLLMGVIHISLSLLRYLRRNWANFGWILFAVGGYLYFPTILKATSMLQFLGLLSQALSESIGIQLLYGGIGFAVLVSLIQHRLKGVGEITRLVSVLADILSYLRLYALALASTIMARTFNSLGIEIGLVLGSVVVLAGHSVNLLLGTMGGVIHGLRLNFIEWYHYSFEGEGRLFSPLTRLRTKQE